MANGVPHARGAGVQPASWGAADAAGKAHHLARLPLPRHTLGSLHEAWLPTGRRERGWLRPNPLDPLCCRGLSWHPATAGMRAPAQLASLSSLPLPARTPAPRWMSCPSTASRRRSRAPCCGASTRCARPPWGRAGGGEAPWRGQGRGRGREALAQGPDSPGRMVVAYVGCLRAGERGKAGADVGGDWVAGRSPIGCHTRVTPLPSAPPRYHLEDSGRGPRHHRTRLAWHPRPRAARIMTHWPLPAPARPPWT